MDLSLPAAVQRQISDRVRSGRYGSAEEVIAAAMASLEQQEWVTSLSPTELQALYPDLKAKLAEGIAAADAGRLSDGEAFFDELDPEDATRSSGRKTA